jgi:hypothetical protein
MDILYSKQDIIQSADDEPIRMDVLKSTEKSIKKKESSSYPDFMRYFMVQDNINNSLLNRITGGDYANIATAMRDPFHKIIANSRYGFMGGSLASPRKPGQDEYSYELYTKPDVEDTYQKDETLPIKDSLKLQDTAVSIDSVFKSYVSQNIDDEFKGFKHIPELAFYLIDKNGYKLYKDCSNILIADNVPYPYDEYCTILLYVDVDKVHANGTDEVSEVVIEDSISQNVIRSFDLTDNNNRPISLFKSLKSGYISMKRNKWIEIKIIAKKDNFRSYYNFK